MKGASVPEFISSARLFDSKNNYLCDIDDPRIVAPHSKAGYPGCFFHAPEEFWDGTERHGPEPLIITAPGLMLRVQVTRCVRGEEVQGLVVWGA